LAIKKKPVLISWDRELPECREKGLFVGFMEPVVFEKEAAILGWL
jgi:hypothetical protein